MKRLEKIYRTLLYILPLALMFSYWPVIRLGGNETMNFELSVPMIWLVVFDVVALVVMARRKVLFSGLKNKWAWLLLPVWLTVSVIWSLNAVRGVLTVGILWLIYLAGYGMWQLRDVFDERARGVFWKWFWGAALLACGWCVIQCILDIVGVPREYSLMCDGCVSQMFGFPHPNGFAIEPQFMGNLLLAPLIILEWLMLRSRPRPSGPSPRADGANSRAAALRNAVSPKHCAILFFALATTLFLTFSRGAIYAFGVGMVFMSAFVVVRERKVRVAVAKRVAVVWLTAVLAFVFALNLQGVMAQVGPTNDTYVDGVAKVLNHLSLGVIDVRGKKEGKSEETQAGLSEEVDVVFAGEETEVELVEKPVENSDLETGATEAVFDGYVEESTGIRMKLTSAAFEVWRKDFGTMMFGVGIGGAGQALYANGLTPEPKEIVQNEYASLLLETGLVGVVLLILTMVLIVRAVAKKPKIAGVVLALTVAYGVSLLFFSGLANALQIYLIPIVLMVLWGDAIKD